MLWPTSVHAANAQVSHSGNDTSCALAVQGTEHNPESAHGGHFLVSGGACDTKDTDTITMADPRQLCWKETSLVLSAGRARARWWDSAEQGHQRPR